VGDDWFRLAPSEAAPLRIYTRDSLAERQDDSGNPEENVLDLGHSYSRSNLTGGEGLDWWPRVVGEPRREIDEIRYWDSGNIDLSRPQAGLPFTAQLVKDVTTFWTPTGSPVDMGASIDAVYIIEGTNVHRFDDWSDTTPEDTDNIAVTLTQLAVGPDNSVAVLDNAGDVWFKGSQTNTYLKVYDSTVDGDDAVAVWWVKDRIIIATNDAASAAQGALREVAPVIGGTPASPTESATVSTVDTFEGACLDVVDAGHAIIACFSDGSIRSYVPQTDTAGGTPALTVRGRTQAPIGEVPYRLAHNLGSVLVLTLEETPGDTSTVTRVYSASVLDQRFDFVVGTMQLLREWRGSAETQPAYTKNMVSTRDEVLFTIGEATSEFNLWRYDLVTGGLFRHAERSRAGTTGLTVFDSRVAFCDGTDVIIDHLTNYVTDGYLITPNITFGLNTAINWTAFTIEVLGLATAGVAVSLYRTTDPEAILDRTHAGWVLVDTLTDPAQSGIERSIVNTTANSLALKVEMVSSTTTLVSPSLTRFAVRGFPKHRDWIAELPINISDMVEAPGRMPLRVDGHGDSVHNTILSLDGAAIDLVVLDPPTSIRGVVDQIMEPTSYITDRGSQGKICMMVIRGSRLTGSTAAGSGGDAGMGVSPMGIGAMGIGDVGEI